MKKAIYIIVFVIISFTAKAQYCTSNLYSVGCETPGLGSNTISSFSFGTFNQYYMQCPSALADRLNCFNHTDKFINLMPGDTSNLSLTIYSPFTNNNVKAWIDYNNDSVFNNTNELIYQLNNVSGGTYNQNIAIPSNATLGHHLMRVRLVSGNSFVDACDTATYGITSDFTVNFGGINDVGVDSISSPQDTVLYGYPIMASVYIHNYGTTTLSNFPVYTSINGTTSSFNLYYGSLAPGSSSSISCMTGYLTVLPSTINFCAYTDLYKDNNTSNDTICKSLIDFSLVPIIDVGIDSILLPTDSVVFGSSFIHPTVKLHNYGNDTINGMYYYYSINNNPPTVIYIIDTILPGNSIITTSPFNIQIQTSNISFCAWIYIPGDLYSFNDTLCKSVIAYASGPYSDIGVDSILIPSDTVATSSIFFPKVKLHNYGTTTLTSVPLGYKINNGAPIYETYNGGVITPGNSAYYTFNTPYTAIAGNFNICACNLLSTDVNNSNNNLCKNVKVTHDVGVIDYILPFDSLLISGTQIVKIVIKNFGTSIEDSIPVIYQKGSYAPIAELWTGTLLPGDTVHHTFQTSFNVPYLSNVSLCSWTNLSIDPNINNDKFCRVVCLCAPPNTAGPITCLPPNTLNGHQIDFHIGETASQIFTFHVNTVSGAVSYVWNYTGTGANFNGNDSNITITFVPGATSGNLTVRGQNNYGLGNSSPPFSINIINNSTYNINETTTSNNIKLSPNPTSDKLNIECNNFNKGKTKFSIYNIQAAKLYSEETLITTDTYTKSIDVGMLKAGIYFIKIETETGVYNSKFVKE